MSYWLYQCNQEKWPPERFRLDIWENERWEWTVPTIREAEGETPCAGDSVAFFYCKSYGHEPGFYGWVVVLYYYPARDGNHLCFRPAAPTNHLKMHPWWNNEAGNLADEIRGDFMRATLWRVSDERWKQIRQGITAWVSTSR